MNLEVIVVVAGLVLCLVCLAVELHQHLRIARQILPGVRRAAMLNAQERIALLDTGRRRTNEMWITGLMTLFTFYFPAVFLLVRGGHPGIVLVFAALTLLQLFVIKVAANHRQIVRQAIEKLSREDRASLATLGIARARQQNK